jgi:tetratricopeptide (TPR) repeat protein
MKRVACILLALLAVLAVRGTVVADTVHLTCGGTVEGRILQQDGTGLRLQVETEDGPRVIRIRASRVDRIEREPTFENDLQAAMRLLDSGQDLVAEAELRALVRRNPVHPQARVALARALVANHKNTEAVKVLEHYIELAPDRPSPDVLMYLAEQHMHAGDFRLARRYARDAGNARPDDSDLQDDVAALVRTIERVRSGQEQLRQRQVQQRDVLTKRRAERAEWDAERGNSHEAQQTAEALVGWATGRHRNLVSSYRLTLNAPDEHLRAYMYGEDVSELRPRVNRAEFRLVINRTLWEGMYDREKAVLVNGWYYQLNDLYPNSNPTVHVYAMGERRGQRVEELVARGSYDGRRDAVRVERFTNPNPDPTRPARHVRHR